MNLFLLAGVEPRRPRIAPAISNVATDYGPEVLRELASVHVGVGEGASNSNVFHALDPICHIPYIASLISHGYVCVCVSLMTTFNVNSHVD